VVKSVVEQPAEVAHTVHATHHVIPAAPLVAPVVHHAAPLISTHVAPAAVSAAVPIGPQDCVTEAGCALRAALATGLPAATFGSATVVGRKRREAEADAEAEAEADAEADPYFLYNGFYGGYPYSAYPYSTALPYNAYPYAPAYPYNYYNPYNYALPAALPEPVEPVEVKAAPLVAAHVPYVHTAPAPVVHTVHAAPAPAVHTTTKEVTYTHLGAHPIAPTTVLQTESRLVL